MIKWTITIIAVIAIGFAAYTQLTIFIVQPIGAAPDGRTIVILRLKSLEVMDSADAWCERKMGGVSLLCRVGVFSRVGQESTVLLRLPYSETLYEISTGGRHYDK